MILLYPQSRGFSQVIKDYEGRVPEDFFQYCLKKEKQLDSIKNALSIGESYYELGKKSLRHIDELALAYNSKALNIFREINHDSLYHMVLCSNSLAHINMGQYELAESCINQGIDYWRRVDNIRWLSSTLLKRGYLERSRGNYVKAIESYLTAEKLSKKDPNLQISGDLYNRMAIGYMDIGDYESAIKSLNYFLDQEETKNSGWRISIMTNLAQCYKKTARDSLARIYYDKVNTVWVKSSSYRTRIHGYTSIANLAWEDKDFVKAELYLDSAYQNAKLYNNANLLSDIETRLLSFYVERNRLDEAQSLIPVLLNNAVKSNRDGKLMNAYEVVSDYYEAVSDYRNALEYRQLYDSLYYKLYSDEVIHQIKHLDIKFEKEEIEEEVSLLEEQNRLKEKNIAAQKKTRFYLTGFLIGLGLIAALLFALYKNKNKTAKALESKNEIINSALESNKMLLKEIHHRVKNNLQVISSLLSLQSRFDPENQSSFAIKTARSRVQAMAILHQKLFNNQDLNALSIRQYFSDLIDDIQDSYMDNPTSVTFHTNIEEIVLDIETIIPLGLIINELITNSLKHAFKDRQAGSISIDIYKLNGDILLKYSDDGIGFPFDSLPETSESLGVEIIKSFAEKLDADISINNKNGASIQFKFSERDYL